MRKFNKTLTSALVLAMGLGLGAAQSMADDTSLLEKSKSMVPIPPWPAGDERGMTNTQGAGTWLRCARHMSAPGAKVYELSHLRSESMPSSPFGKPLDYDFKPSFVLPGTKHVFNGETVSGETAAQATQMDALGHFGYLEEAWSGDGNPPYEAVKYYGGHDQKDVKPSPESPLLKLGIEKAAPIVTSAILLDARQHLGGGKPLRPGQLITRDDINAMLQAQGLADRGLLPGDVLYVYTGWSDLWKDPDVDKAYYTMGPGLAYDAALMIEEKAVVLVALDNPFTDPANEGFIFGKAPPAEGTPDGLPWAIHHHNLTQSGIHQIQNARLGELARDKVWQSCTMVLPLRIKGGAGSPVRPIAIGAGS